MPRKPTGPRLAVNAQEYYEIRWSEGRRSRHVSTGTRNLDEASQALAGFLTESRRAVPTTVATILDTYDTGHVAERVTDKKRARQIITNLKSGLGHYNIADLDQTAADLYVRERRLGRHGKGRATDGTIRRELTVLIAAANDAARAKRISRDDVPALRLPAPPPPKDRWLTDEEFARLLAACPTPRARRHAKRLGRLYRFCMLARYTAARRRSIETLTWFQVDLERRLIDFREPGKTRTKKRRVPVPISDTLYPVLVEAHATKLNEFVLDHPGRVIREFGKLADAAGMPEVTPHTLRHTWATRAAQSGRVTIIEIAGVLGDTIATVERNYLHHCPEHLRSAVNFDAAISAQSGQ